MKDGDGNTCIDPDGRKRMNTDMTRLDVIQNSGWNKTTLKSLTLMLDQVNNNLML